MKSNVLPLKLQKYSTVLLYKVEDFMFQLPKEKFEHWKSQFATSNSVVMGAQKTYVFTENGVAMLDSFSLF